MDQDLRTWGAREGLSGDIISILAAQGFNSVSGVRDLTPDLISDFFQKPGILNVAQCMQLKRAIDKLGSTSSSSVSGGGGGGGYGYGAGTTESFTRGFSSMKVSDGRMPSAGHRQPSASPSDSYSYGRGGGAYSTSSYPSGGSGKEETFRFLLLGKTGSGKSTTGNTIFGRELFSTAPTFSSVTSECERKICTRGNKKLEIMDSPGLYDTHMTQEEICMIIVQSVAGMHPGPHAILYVVRMGRYTAEEYGAYKRLKALFDASISKYMIVLFTGGDMLEQSNTTVEAMLQRNTPKELQEVLGSARGGTPSSTTWRATKNLRWSGSSSR